LISNRTTFALLALSALAAAWGTAPPSASQEFEYRAVHLAGPVYFLEGGQGGNVGLIAGDDEVVLIDNQFERTAPALAAAVAEVTERPVDFLLNTHFHPDHTEGNPFVAPDATILAHENVRTRLEQPGARGGPSPAMLAGGLPTVTFRDSVALHVAGLTARVEHFPAAHTDGDSALFLEDANVLFSGDVFFSGRFPFIDLGAGGSSQGVLAAARAMLARIDDRTKVVPGHGPLSTKADLAAYVDMLTEARAKVFAAAAAGRTAEEMKRADLLADYSDWSWSFISAERFIDTLAAEAEQGR